MVDQLDEVLAEHRLQPVAVLLTHGHIDHTFSVTPVCGARDVPAYLHPDDDAMLADPLVGISPETAALFGGRLEWTEPDDVRPLADGEVLRSPGSSSPSTTRRGTPAGRCSSGSRRTTDDPEVCLSGDVLFAGSIGRTDLPGGDHDTMLRSLATKVLPLPDEVVVLPGHGPQTTIGRERASNPFLQDLPATDAAGPTGTVTHGRRLTPLSGFPEWLPGERIVEQHVLDTLREVFELHGFASIETRAVEPLEQLLRKGEIDKEVYVLRRLQAARRGRATRAATLGLHFDLTVPFARYVLENAGHLEFPFRRYQIQKAWRGERPQEGRYREFIQADIDVIDRDALPFHYEVEIARVMAEALARLPLPPVRMQVNNRKLIEGYYRGVGVEPTTVAA